MELVNKKMEKNDYNFGESLFLCHFVMELVDNKWQTMILIFIDRLARR